MKVAMAVWNGRISPVFDTSRRLEVFGVENGAVVSQEERIVETDDPIAKATTLSELGITALICGAVSQPLAEMIVARGIRLVPFVAGDAKEVLAASLADSLPNPNLTMPGCCRRQWRFHGGRGQGCQRDRSSW